MKHIYRALYLSISLHFARRIASRLFPGKNTLYFICIVPTLPKTELTNSLVVVSHSWRRIRPTGTGRCSSSSLWDTACFSLDDMADYAAGRNIHRAVPLQAALAMARSGKLPYNLSSGLESIAKAFPPCNLPEINLLSREISKRTKRR